MDQPGFDYKAGFGVIDAPNALSRIALSHFGTEYDYHANGLDTADNDHVYLSVTESGGVAGNRVLAVDPLTGLEVWSMDLAFTPGQIAVANDGSKLYVAEHETATIFRIDTETSTIDLEFLEPDEIRSADRNMDVQPGNPDVLAITRVGTSEPISIMVRGIEIPQGHRQAEGREIVFSDDGHSLFSTDNLEILRYSVSEESIVRSGTVLDHFENTSIYDRIATSGNVVVTGAGVVVDATTMGITDDLFIADGQRALVTLSGNGERLLFIIRKEMGVRSAIPELGSRPTTSFRVSTLAPCSCPGHINAPTTCTPGACTGWLSGSKAAEYSSAAPV